MKKIIVSFLFSCFIIAIHATNTVYLKQTKIPVLIDRLDNVLLYIRIDAAANFPDFANHRENIARDLALAKDAGFTDIVVDIRPTSGDIFYKSSVAGMQQVIAMTSYPVYLTKWLEFRAKVIHDFMDKARNAVKSVNPAIKFGAYVGAWYATYYEVGVNWASPKYNPSTSYKWATEKYKDYGYVDMIHLKMANQWEYVKRGINTAIGE